MSDVSQISKVGFIETFTGKMFQFADPTEDMICIEDIAHALSNLCRYNGHCQRFYSVAEHSILLSEAYVWGNEVAFAMLMHDASEAYLCDIPRPIKYTLPDYRTLEAKLDQAIAKKFGLEWPHPNVVREWDGRAILDERSQAMSRSKNNWNMEGLHALGITLHFWSPPEAEARFLANFHRLSALIQKEVA